MARVIDGRTPRSLAGGLPPAPSAQVISQSYRYRVAPQAALRFSIFPANRAGSGAFGAVTWARCAEVAPVRGWKPTR